MRQAQELRRDKAAIYIRWSTEDQGEGTTLTVQLEACQSYVRSQGWAVSEDLLFVDDGISGATLARPALTRLRALVQAGAVDCVVVYKLDRLSRSVLDMLKLVLDEWDGICCLKSAREPIDTLTQTGKMFFYQLMSFAEWERSVIRERTFSGKLRRAQEKRNPGISAAYGYRLGSSGDLAVQPDEAALVRQIFAWYLCGDGMNQIVGRLHQQGARSPRGARWTTGTLSRLLSNPIYTGELHYGKRTTVGGRRVRSAQPLLVVPGVAPAIVDAATFAAVQTLKASKPGVLRQQGCPRSAGAQSLLTGLLKCRCGHSGGAVTMGHGHYRYYACCAMMNQGQAVCDGGRIRQELLDDLVVRRLLERFGDSVAREQLLKEATAKLRQDLERLLAARGACAGDLARAEARAAKLNGLLLEGTLSIQEFRDLKAQVDRHCAGCREALDDCDARIKAAEHALQGSQALSSQLAVLDRWSALSAAERKQLLRHFVSRITAYRDRRAGAVDCTITWNWPQAGPEHGVAPASTPAHRA